MVLDHTLVFLSPHNVLRFTVTRAAVPLFFLVSGRLVRDKPRQANRKRLAIVFVIGFVLPVVAPWVDAPNVLVWYVIGYFLIRASWTRPILIVLALTEFANGFGAMHVHTYEPLALWGIMAFGKYIPVSSFRCPDYRNWLARIGQYPLSIYVGHILLFQLVFIGRLGVA